MALLTALVNPDMIRLVRGWQRNTMLRYLHTTSKKFTDGLVVCMFQYGDYALILPAHAAVYQQVAQTDYRTTTKQGFLGAWYRIGVALTINKSPFTPTPVYSIAAP